MTHELSLSLHPCQVNLSCHKHMLTASGAGCGGRYKSITVASRRTCIDGSHSLSVAVAAHGREIIGRHHPAPMLSRKSLLIS